MPRPEQRPAFKRCEALSFQAAADDQAERTASGHATIETAARPALEAITGMTNINAAAIDPV